MNFEDANVIIPLVNGQPGLGERTPALRKVFVPFEAMDPPPAAPENRAGVHAVLVITLEAHVKKQTAVASLGFLQGVGVVQKTHSKPIVNSLQT